MKQDLIGQGVRLMKGDWVKWIMASLSAGIAGAFTMLTYIHSNFVDAAQMTQHLEQPHQGAITVERYDKDLDRIYEQLLEINRKLDRIK